MSFISHSPIIADVHFDIIGAAKVAFMFEDLCTVGEKLVLSPH